MKWFQNALDRQPGNPPRAGFCQIQQGLDQQPKCGGCRRIEALIQYWITSRTSKSGRQASQSVPELIHNSYKELDSCSHRCITCRVIRRGFLLNQSTTSDANNLSTCTHQVWVTITGVELNKMTLRIILQTSLNSPRAALTSSTIYFAQEGTHPVEVSLATRADTKSVYNQVRSWAAACNQGHPECGNLNWSSKNPTRLLQIKSASEVQLVDARQEMGLTNYTALSYCWGTPDDEQTQRGRTTADNFVLRHSQPFPITELPATIRDAINLTKGCGLEYIWVDSVCIIQGDVEDWLTEANRMHEVYANAYFTICAVSVDSASAGLFHSRQAWNYNIEPCQLASKRISIHSSSVRKLIQGSTWSSRAWTLQEEHLSPRMVYWTPQKMYWSCSKCLVTEGESRGHSTSTAVAHPPVSSFLAASRSGLNLHERWYDMVESFTKRSLTNPTDKLPAISGIAMRYHRYRGNDEYLAGLWRDTFAMDLAWRTSVYLLEVQKPVCENQRIPSWSWASLPCGHPAVMRRRHCESGDEQHALLLVKSRPSHADEGGLAETIVRSVQVKGRMRPLLSGHPRRKEWSDVSVRDADGKEKFSFRNCVDDDVYCVDLSRGLVLAYEAHREESIGQVEYVVDADRVYQGTVEVECLELGQSEMLLLERCESKYNGTEHLKGYRRIGVSWDFRGDFFDGKAPVEIELF